MTAILQAESGLNPQAQGWNCLYEGRSHPCHPQDRHLAWSVDCGIAQINVRGTQCPDHLFDMTQNLLIAYEKYQTRGFNPWVAYRKQTYLQFIK
ncbi:MAG: hypothetical protein UY02_C0033G0006 [Candidatus Giovannonibacteria bacterium GW2011_GWB1_47_6b]|uniref:Transglycosylase SLT domain-containing protein n=1 Tax=Candidatus Giovannonibacteria bacterium GW2011_GWB1_47_6b TaxID=1618655 RepID=A0A0G1T2T1_9BACT|nr:MAG: hypothetical protein UY02_C0033G0006 [Candidatus Giovannonibacteria bacterium GW2011_GWB1_47_6b]